MELLVRNLDHDIEAFRRVAAESETLEELIVKLTANYRDLGQRPDRCLLASEFQLYASRVGRSDSEFSRVYEDFRDRLSGLLDAAFKRFNFRGELSARQLASAIIGLSHGLALERPTSKTNLPMEVTGMAIRALLLRAAANTARDRGGS